MKLIDKYKAIQKIDATVETPFHVWSAFGEKQKVAYIFGNQICLGEDCVDLQQARNAIGWYVDQLGGKVTWSK